MSTGNGLADHVDGASGEGASAVFLDLDTAVLEARQGRRGPELQLRPDVAPGLERLRQVVDHLVLVVDPDRGNGNGPLTDEHRVAYIQEALGSAADDLIVMTCSHTADDGCDCLKPGSGLIRRAAEEHGLDLRRGWHIGADQMGVSSGRSAGLTTIRIGPQAGDVLSSIHRADHIARDLLDAANRILMETLSRPAATAG